MLWHLSYRADPRARPLADRHYNRQKIGAKQFVPPGRCLVLLTEDADALWITSWPEARYVKHAWPGAWMNSLFRNENKERFRASDLILDALAATRWRFGEPPALGLVSFIDERKTRQVRVRGVPQPGFCYVKAGATILTERTKTEKLLVAQFLPEAIPAAAAPHAMPQEEW